MIQANSRSLDGSTLSRRHISEHCHRSIGEALGLETPDARSLPAEQEVALAASPSISLVEAA